MSARARARRRPYLHVIMMEYGDRRDAVRAKSNASLVRSLARTRLRLRLKTVHATAFEIACASFGRVFFLKIKFVIVFVF